MISFRLLVATGAVLLSGCTGETTSGTNVVSAPPSSESRAGEKMDQDRPAIAVTLNNGERWDANPETTQGVMKMAKMVESFPDDASPVDYHTLKIGLEEEFGTILRKCTMKGEAHDQLHNYLVPLREMFSDLASDDATRSKIAVDKLRYHLRSYGDYFR